MDNLWKADLFSDLPREPQAAESAARQFFHDANLRLANTAAFRKAGLRRLFPENLKSAGNALVSHIDTGKPAHWLCWFSVTLPTAVGQPDAVVSFAVIEVRVGVGGKIAGLWSKWRPYTTDEAVTRIPLSSLNGSKSTSAAQGPSLRAVPGAITKDSDDEQAVQLVYMAGDENAIQTLLAPYYMITNSDFALVAPASSHSLIVNIEQDASPNGITLQAIVTGGSRNYNYRWARFSPISVWNDGMQDLGSSDQVRVDAGVHNIILLVEDKLTGAQVQTESMVYA
jgi:hypothetical protein